MNTSYCHTYVLNLNLNGVESLQIRRTLRYITEDLPKANLQDNSFISKSTLDECEVGKWLSP